MQSAPRKPIARRLDVRMKRTYFRDRRKDSTVHRTETLKRAVANDRFRQHRVLQGRRRFDGEALAR
jgi:hypothetical protein